VLQAKLSRWPELLTVSTSSAQASVALSTARVTLSRPMLSTRKFQCPTTKIDLCAALLFRSTVHIIFNFTGLFSPEYGLCSLATNFPLDMATRIEADKLEAMSKKELVDLVQSVASLELLQANF
jgi:hypothetical protein